MNKIRLEGGVKFTLFVLLAAQLFLPNGVYLFICVAVLYGGFFYIQQPFKSSVFTIIFLYHFAQIIGGVWQASYLGKDINYRTPNMGYATIISLIGLIVIFLPIIYYHNKIPPVTLETLRKHANRLSLNKTFYIYVAYFFFSGLLNGIRFLLPH